jgi:biopolymer transport protein ExbB/TolQ
VVKPWQVRVLSLVTSRVMLLVYLVGIITWGWMASQAAQVPFLRHELARYEEDALRLDSLSATLTELQSRYDQVQRMLSAATAQQAAAAAIDTAKPAVPPPTKNTGR